jgi:hypothetical protein
MSAWLKFNASISRLQFYDIACIATFLENTFYSVFTVLLHNACHENVLIQKNIFWREKETHLFLAVALWSAVVSVLN